MGLLFATSLFCVLDGRPMIADCDLKYDVTLSHGNYHRRFILLRLDDAPSKGSLAQFHGMDLHHNQRESEYPKLLGGRRTPRLGQDERMYRNDEENPGCLGRVRILTDECQRSRERLGR